MNTVLITGASRGIGRALAQKYLREGWFVLGTSLDGALAEESPNLKAFRLDLSSPAGISQCVAEIKQFGRRIDILHNNAGVLLDEDETKVVIEKLRQTLEVNLIGTIDFTEQILPLINEGGHIVNTSSSAGSLNEAGFEGHFFGYYPAYKISKAALNMYTRTLANRLGEKITVSSIHPGWVKTDMGGPEADLTPEEAAESIYHFATTNKDTGQFWFNGKRFPW
jgi:NAD(P)-dependent dehydrogenase (short-subunit alcohol dehydrogenase family)